MSDLQRELINVLTPVCSVRTWALPAQSWACAGWVSLVLTAALLSCSCVGWHWIQCVQAATCKSLPFPEIHGEILCFLGASRLSLWKLCCDIFTETTSWKTGFVGLGMLGNISVSYAVPPEFFFRSWIQNWEEVLINQVVVPPFRGIFRGWINGLARNEAH